MITRLKQDKAQSGTAILLGLIVSLFVIGLLVMIFALMGSSLQNASYTRTSGSVTNESHSWGATGGHFNLTSAYLLLNPSCSVSKITNTTNGVLFTSGNYTVTSCAVYNATPVTADDKWNATYTYTYDANNTATETIYATTGAISSATDFFDLFIVIGSMVVLVLLTVIIIVAIKSSGFMGQNSA